MNRSLCLIPLLVISAFAQEPPATLLSGKLVELAREPMRLRAAPEAPPPGLAEGPAPAPAETGDEAAELARLAKLAPTQIPLQAASLAEAITIIANTAEMNHIAPPLEEFPETVTLTTKVSPWKLLTLLGDRYRFTMRYREGVWVFDREAVGALVAKMYELKHTNLDVHKASQNSFTDMGSVQSMGDGGSGSGGGGGGGGGGLVFSPQTQKIIDDIRDLIGLPPSTIAKDGKVPEDSGKRAVEGKAAESPEGTAKSAAKVLYLADVNTLYVTCTRGQHEHVAEYLRLLDRPVKQIAIEARFFETARDPKLVLGINPENFQPKISLSEIESRFSLGNLHSLSSPDNVLLSADTLSLQLNALRSDSNSRLVQNPSVVTASNREVYFSVGDEEPFVSMNSINPGGLDGGFGSTQARISMRRIGTSINIVPTLFSGDNGQSKIRLVVRIEVGVLKGFRRINSVDVPVVSSQKYEYTVYIKEGDTLAFGGLTGVTESEDTKKVPMLGDVPVLGYAFKSNSKRVMQRNLVAYITARSLSDAERSVVMPPVTTTMLPEPPPSPEKPFFRLTR